MLLFVLLSCCASMVLLMTFSKVGVQAQECCFSEVFDNLWQSLKDKSHLSTILMFAFFYLALTNEKQPVHNPLLFKILAVTVAFLWLIAENFRIDDKFIHSTQSAGQVIKSCLYVLGMSFVLYNLFLRLENLLTGNICDWAVKPDHRCVLYASNVMKNYILVVCLLLLAWLPHAVIVYPANMCYDSWDQIAQYWGIQPFTAHHPPVSTLLFGYFAEIGKWIYNANFGLFLFVLFQMLIYALIISYEIKLMRDLCIPSSLQLITFFCACILPCYTSYVNLLLKDNLYSISVLLFVIEMVYACAKTRTFFTQLHHFVISFIAVLGVYLLRNNGKHILYPTLALLAWGLWKRRKNLKRNWTVKACFLLVVPIFVAQLVNFYVVHKYHVEKGGIQEIFSLPFQQTARYVCYHADDVTDSEKVAINAVLNYDKIAQVYHPRLSDHVKNTFRWNSPTKKRDLLSYMKVWLRMFFKHPGTYFAATLNQNYLLYYPFKSDEVAYFGSYTTFLYQDKSWFSRFTPQLKQKIGYTNRPDVFSNARSVLKSFEFFLYSCPLTGVLCHVATYVIFLLYLCCGALRRKIWSMLVISCPLLMSVLVVIFAPAIHGHPRYAFPVVYSLPVVIAYYMYKTYNNTNS